MNINLTETEALTIADFLVEAITTINGLDSRTDAQRDFVNAANQFIIQTWTQSDEQDKQMIIEEQRQKMKDVN